MTQAEPTSQCPDATAAPSERSREPCDKDLVLAAKGPSCRDFRSTLGRFATGITVLTALDAKGAPIGLTINSFNSVSLDPPLILWSLALSSPNLEVFRRATYYAVNILSADQQTLSERFASPCNDRFSDVATRPGLGGVPLIDDCCAWFECSNEAYYPGGDHLIFVGRVGRCSAGEKEDPLIFHAARYRRLDASSTVLTGY